MTFSRGNLAVDTLFCPQFDSNTPKVMGCPLDAATLRREITEIIGMLERRLGPRDKSYCINSVVRNRKSCVQIGIGGETGVEEHEVIIWLTRPCWQDESYRAGILSHECVHVLNPVHEHEISFLEEGVAEWFARSFAKSRFPNWMPEKVDPRYVAALQDVELLLSLRPNAIAEIRAVELSLSRVTTDELLNMGTDLDLARRLCEKFCESN